MAKGKRNADELLLQALAFGATNEQAAQLSGLSKRTVCRRKAEPDFQRRIRALQVETEQRALGILTLTLIKSAKTFMDLQKEQVPYPYRLGAARANYQCQFKLRQQFDLETRLADLEALLASEGLLTAKPGVLPASPAPPDADPDRAQPGGRRPRA
jgi:hypothetical protein